MKNKYHYSKSELTRAIRMVGVQPGDIIFSHVGMGMLGFPKEGSDEEVAYNIILEAFQEVLGENGTLLIPTYSYSFCEGERYNPRTSPSKVGPFSEFFRQQKHVKRSLDPIFSVAGIGPKTDELFFNLPHDCFGEGCIYERLIHVNAKICNIGVGFRYATFIHHIEQMVGVPYRYRKLFVGDIEVDGECRSEGWIYYVRILAENSYPDLRHLEQDAKASKKCRFVRVGLGEVTCINCSELNELGRIGISKDRWYLAKGPAGNPIDLEQERVIPRTFKTGLTSGASMTQIIDSLWNLPRDIVSDGYDAALNVLAGISPMIVHEYPTGTECWTWIVPEKWTCLEAFLETLDGNRIFSYSDHPLHVASYSQPFEGIVKKEELFKHLTIHPFLPDAIPFHYLFYKREWGLCCSQKAKEALTDEQYRVVIKTEFSYSTLKVGEIIVRGQNEESIVLCGHLDHPAQVNDGLSGVVVGLDVMRELRKRTDLRYTYRLIIVPETIGSLAYLSHNEHIIPTLKGGIFLEMLALKNHHSLQLSYSGETEFDRCCLLALKEMDPLGRTGKFLEVVTNDERQFNAPGLRIPMVSLSRVQNPCGKEGAPSLPEYHSHLDSNQLISPASLEESRDLVMRMIDIWEKNMIPQNNYKGEVFLARFGINFDFKIDPEYGQALFEVMHSIDGTSSLAKIALKSGRKFATIYHIVHEFKKKGLIK